MENRLPKREARLLPIAAIIRAVVATLLLLVLASCVSQAMKDAEIAVVEAERVAAAQVLTDQERARAAELQAQRELAVAERARVEEVKQRQLVEAKARVDAEREEQEAIAQAERDRRAAIAAAQRQDRLDRITALEQQIASIETEVGEEESRASTLTRAIQTAEELLTTLTAEQTKYENTDELGNTVEPLEKELIAELESVKNELVRQANSL